MPISWDVAGKTSHGDSMPEATIKRNVRLPCVCGVLAGVFCVRLDLLCFASWGVELWETASRAKNAKR